MQEANPLKAFDLHTVSDLVAALEEIAKVTEAREAQFEELHRLELFETKNDHGNKEFKIKIRTVWTKEQREEYDFARKVQGGYGSIRAILRLQKMKTKDRYVFVERGTERSLAVSGQVQIFEVCADSWEALRHNVSYKLGPERTSAVCSLNKGTVEYWCRDDTRTPSFIKPFPLEASLEEIIKDFKNEALRAALRRPSNV